MTMEAVQRNATVMNLKVQCPYCGSVDVLYAEDITNKHKIRSIENGVILLESDCETDDLTANERIFCNECSVDSGLPEGYELQFEV
jgi:DNA-directed RNA polymerase subunit RPC12/RpoP